MNASTATPWLKEHETFFPRTRSADDAKPFDRTQQSKILTMVSDLELTEKYWE